MTAHVPTDVAASSEDLDQIRQVALDYVEGYLDGDATRHARAYHPECLKRRMVVDEESGVTEVVVLSPQTMVDYAAQGPGQTDPCDIEVLIDAVSQDIASVRVYSCKWVDFLHVVKARGEWRLFNVTWHGR